MVKHTSELEELADISMLSNEQIGTYTRAFIERKADYIIIDGWELRKQWVRDDLRQLEGLGYLAQDQDVSEANSDTQYTAVAYRPTKEFVAALRNQGDTNAKSR